VEKWSFRRRRPRSRYCAGSDRRDVLGRHARGVVEVDNFYEKGVPTNAEGDATVTGTRAYRIGYLRQANKSSFHHRFAVRGEPRDGRSALLNALGITKTEACKLNVVIRSAWFVEDAPVTGDLPLSFCKSGLQ